MTFFGTTNNTLQLESKMFGTEPLFKEPRYSKILVIMNTIQKPICIIYPDIMNKCQHLTNDKCETDQQ